MTGTKRTNLALELLSNIVIFNKENDIVFIGEDIKISFSQSGIEIEKILSEKIIEKKQINSLDKYLEHVKENQKPRSFKFEKLDKVFILFPSNFNSQRYIILTLRDEILLINKIEHELNERVKELEGLYNISKTLEIAKSLDDALQKSALFIEKGFQYPKLTKVNFEIRGEVYGCKDINEKDIQNTLIENIILNGDIIGEIRVYCKAKVP